MNKYVRLNVDSIFDNNENYLIDIFFCYENFVKTKE